MKILLLALLLSTHAFAQSQFKQIQPGVNFGNSSSDPSTGRAGDVYYSSSVGALRFYNGSTWSSILGISGSFSIGTIDGQTPSANGLVLSGTSIFAQSASASNPGMVNTSTQTFAGAKTFSVAPNLSSLTASLPLQLDGSKNITAAQIGLTTQVTGTLPVGNGGTGNTSGSATLTAITDDTTTNATMFPTWVTTSSSNQAQKVSSSKLTFNPSTATLTTTNLVGAVTGTASGNTTYSANNHGVVLSGSGNTMTVLAPDASVTKVLTSGGSSADPVWAAAAGGSSTGINFIGLNTSFVLGTQSDIDAEASVGNWLAYADAAGTVPVDMTGGSPNTTCLRTTTAGHLVDGIGSLEIVKGAANRQGEGCAVVVNIPLGYRGQQHQVIIPISVFSGSLVAGDLIVAAYDVTNSTLIPVMGCSSFTSSQVLVCTITIPLSTTQMRLGFHFATTVTTAVTLDFDDIYLGPPKTIGNVNQAQFIGSAFIPVTGSCSWSRTNTALGSFSTTAACPGPTVEFNPGPGTIQTTDTDLPKFTINSLPAGYYEIKMTVPQASTTGNGTVCFAINDGTTTSGNNCYSPTNNGIAQSLTVIGYFNYTNSGNRTFELFNSATTLQVTVTNSAGQSQLGFSAIRYPGTQDTVVSANQTANAWGGHHGSDCQWTTTSASYVDPTDDASCTLTEDVNVNFGTVSSKGAKGPGIVFTPSRLGVYQVCAQPNIQGTIAGVYGLKLWDGTTTISETSTNNDVASEAFYVPVCGLYRATSTASTTISLQMKISTGTMSMGVGTNQTINWQIFQIDQNFPMPIFSGTRSSVVFDTANGHGSTNTTTRKWTNVTTVGNDFTATQNATNGDSVTCNTSMLVGVNYFDTFTGSSNMGITLNGATSTTQIQSQSIGVVKCITSSQGANTWGACSATFSCISGDVIRANDQGGTTGATNQTGFQVYKMTY